MQDKEPFSSWFCYAALFSLGPAAESISTVCVCVCVCVCACVRVCVIEYPVILYFKHVPRAHSPLVTGSPIPVLVTTTLLQTIAHFSLTLGKTPQFPLYHCQLVCLPASLRTGFCCLPDADTAMLQALYWQRCSDCLVLPAPQSVPKILQTWTLRTGHSSLTPSLFLPARIGLSVYWKVDTCCLLKWTSSGWSNR